MGLFGFLGGIVKPIANLIDKVHTSDAERLELKAVLRKLENDVTLKCLDYEQKIIEVQGSIIVAEAKSSNWLTSAWRPMTMLTFVFLIVYSTFTEIEIPPDLWTVIKLGLGGYVIGRSAEKIVPGVVSAMKGKEEV